MARKKKISFFTTDAISSGELKRKKSIFKVTGDEYFGSEIPTTVDFSRISFIKVVVFVVCFLFFARIFQLTVVEGAKNRDLADNNRIRLVNLEAKRGRIFDRRGKLLAYSEEKYFLTKDEKKAEITGEQASQLEAEGLAGESFSGSLGKISKEVVRAYPYKEVVAHVIGYTSIAQEEDLGKNPALVNSDFVGRLGVEETYDQVLRGANGSRIIEVDASGKTISILGNIDAKEGRDIYLSVDVDMQKRAYDSMVIGLSKVKEKSGSLIVMDPISGEVLALLSFPSFDPSDIGKSVASVDKPLFNRAIAGNYAPGSVFKIVSSIAGLESQKITKDTEVEDVGQFELGGAKFANWYYLTYGGKDGRVKVDRAIARSNDIFFYRLGEVTGLEEIRKWALRMGYGQKTGIDLPGEAFGLVPDETWKIANVGDNWYLGDTMHMAIGQGFVIATPLQVNVMTSYAANGGSKVTPHVVAKVIGADGKEINIDGPKTQDQFLNFENLEVVRSGMQQACRDKGTAFPFFKVDKYTIACKTGTAEKILGNPHAWFSAYAPYDYPELAIVVMIENGGEGSSVAAPVAKEVLDWYFAR